jgi:glycerol-3-phosphate acyltransferase PlsX
MIWIAVDAMGGDYAPRHVVDGALAAARHFDLGVTLVGPTALLESEVARHGDADPNRVRFVDATDVVAMEESPAAALRRKRGASIRVAADVVARGDAAALFSAGHTGATVMAAHAAFGMLPGVDRPALAATIPRRAWLAEAPQGAKAAPAVLLDVGASVECRPQHLLQFAVMGTVFARVAFGIATPRVGLLSIGEEATKGNELTREAHQLLKSAPLSFIGNIEARDVYSGQADVIVCDGFTGNVALKISEGLVDMIEGLLGEELSSTITMRVGSLLTRRALRRFRRRVDYSEYGGAPLLGVAGVAIVGHGRSSAKAVRNAVAMAYRFASQRFIQRVQDDIAAAAVPHS